VPEGADADAADAEALYRVLEEEVVPLFYARDARGVPVGWVDRMKHALSESGARFTARRMVEQYVRECYVPAMGDAGGDDPPTG
jgi:starch phosphorylase